jgi:predicted nucleic acid-binding Zn ribbon protein
MECCVCDKDIPPQRHYCDRCRDLLRTTKDHMKRRMALRAAYDPSIDAFRDNWSHVELEPLDRSDPFFLVFDHLVPVESSELVASSALFNRMKTDMAPDEFRTAFKLLAAHLRGEPFDKGAIRFVYWKRHPPHPPRPAMRLYPEEVAYPRVDACVICGKPPWRGSIYCVGCREFIFWRGVDRARRARAMKEAWDPRAGRFICQYTGAEIEDGDASSPWYLSFDHATPGDPESIVVCAVWVNSMKNALTRDEFWKVVKEYDRYLRDGDEFDRDVVEYSHWKMARRTARRRRR